MAVREIKIRNKNTGNVRVIDYHVQDGNDPVDLRTFHAKHKPIIHVKIDVGPDEEVIT